MRIIIVPLVLSVALITVGSMASAQNADIGKKLYADYCSTCHGPDAKGGGELAPLLTVKPADLTVLSQRNNGEYPMLKVIHIIDGRTGIRAHGGEMPVWGQSFSDLAGGEGNPVGSVLQARGMIMSLAMYLETLQD